MFKLTTFGSHRGLVREGESQEMECSPGSIGLFGPEKKLEVFIFNH